MLYRGKAFTGQLIGIHIKHSFTLKRKYGNVYPIHVRIDRVMGQSLNGAVTLG